MGSRNVRQLLLTSQWASDQVSQYSASRQKVGLGLTLRTLLPPGRPHLSKVPQPPQRALATRSLCRHTSIADLSPTCGLLLFTFSSFSITTSPTLYFYFIYLFTKYTLKNRKCVGIVDTPQILARDESQSSIIWDTGSLGKPRIHVGKRSPDLLA